MALVRRYASFCGVRPDLEAADLRDVDAVRAQARHLRGVVGQQADPLHPEVGEDRRRRAVLAPVRGPAEVEVGLDGVPALVLQRVRGDLGQQADPAALVPAQVDDGAALLGGELQGRVELRAAVAAGRAERVAREALGVHAHDGRRRRGRAVGTSATCSAPVRRSR